VKVVIPSSPKSAKGLLISAVQDPNPVIFLEPRWLYKVRQEVPEGLYTIPLDRADRVRRGRDITVVAYGDGLHTARQALELVDDIDVELIDLVSINPIDYDTIATSVKKTGKLVCIETANKEFSPSSDVIAALAKRGVAMETPVVVGTPSVPCPTSTALTEEYYPTAVSVANTIRAVCKSKLITKGLTFEELHLPPSTLIV
jgi:pyruvate dehydrogenase E1 component beta subunit